MDLDTIRDLTVARDRKDLEGLGAGTAVLAGGTWLYSEPQDRLHGLVDITGLDWPPLVCGGNGLEIAATCTLAELADTRYPARWQAARLFRQSCGALAASHKIRRTATVGGNVCLALPAGAVLAALVALDAAALVWGPGTDYRVRLSRLVTGPGTTTLGTRDVLRSVHIDERNMSSRTAFRRIALSPHGPSGAVVMGRLDPDGPCRITLTAATTHPIVLEFPCVPPARELSATIAELDMSIWYDDPHGAPGWRRHQTGRLAAEVADELAGDPV